MLALDVVEDKDLVLFAEVLVLVEVRGVEDQVFVAEDQFEDEVAVHHEHLSASPSSWHQLPLR